MSDGSIPQGPASWPLDRQGVAVPGTEKPGYSAVYQNSEIPHLRTSETTYDLFNIGRKKAGSKPCLGQRPWDPVLGDYKPEFAWITYDQVEELRTAIGSAVGVLAKDKKLGENVGQSDFTVAFWAQSRPEFQIVDLANCAYDRRTVALYESYDQESAVYILDHSESKILFTTSNHLADILSAVDQLPHLKTVVLIEDNRPAPVRPGDLKTPQLAAQWAAKTGITLLTWDDALQLGRANLAAHTPPKDINVIAGYCYTSGTTGKPKAAEIHHGQMPMAAAGLNYMADLGTEESIISYLPLAHIYGRLAEAACFRQGWKIGYFNGDPTRLTEDMQILKPSIMFSVPRVLNRIAALISAQADGPGLKGRLLRAAIDAKVQNHDADGTITHAFYDRVVFRKVRAVLGGNVKVIISGSAPLRPDVFKLIRVCFSCDVREGYGQTENSGYLLLMRKGDKKLGTCGPPTPGMELKLKDCPELGYTAQDKPFPRGELLSRGQGVFTGYYKDEAKTKETIDEEGWLHSGDVASIDDQGRVSIIDRVKNLLKLSQGEYVAIENVEGKLGSLKYFAQFWLYGNSHESHLVAIAVPEPEVFAAFASSVLGKKISGTDGAALKEACNDKKVTQEVLKQLIQHGRSVGLKGFEIPRALKLRAEPFSVEDGTLTPTMKFKRHEAAQILKKDIDALYAASPASL